MQTESQAEKNVLQIGHDTSTGFQDIVKMAGSPKRLKIFFYIYILKQHKYQFII